MQRIEILLFSVLVTFVQGTNFSQSPNWQRLWIKGGSDADPGQFPYHVIIAFPYICCCSGSIIADWYILTAAHCVANETAASVTVITGTNQVHDGGQRYAVSRIHIHPLYEQPNNTNDIALLKLMQPVVYSSTVQLIPLTNQGETVAPGTECIFAGWGSVTEAGIYVPNDLQKVLVTIIPNNECEKYYINFFSRICGSVGYGRATCKGDSGGPLVCGGKQVGVLRGSGYNTTVCGTDFPVDYIDVSKYMTWIKDITYWGL